MTLATPRADGFTMPAEWAPHQCCLMAWPARRSLWAGRFEQAKADYAEIGRAVAEFEPVVMICQPGAAGEVRRMCGSAVTIEEIAIDDSWTRDSGPIFVRHKSGELAVVDFRFNSWGGKYRPFDRDADLARAYADVLGVRRYVAPMVLEGGAFFVDGEGTLITTEGPLLDPRRNPDATKEQIETVLASYLGADRVIWLVAAPDRDTDGHIDGIAQYVGPGQIVLLVPDDTDDENHGFAVENLRRLAAATDACGRPLAVERFPVTGEVSHLNCYLANDAVIVPLASSPASAGSADEAALDFLRKLFPARTVVGVPGATLAYGGGGPHCITQQVPAPAPAQS